MKVRERKDDGQGWQHAISGAAAGMTASVITCPFDVVKARMQSQRGTPTSQSYQGTFRSLLNIWKKEGIRGWYRGFNITMGSYLPNWTIYFTAYHETKLFLADEYSCKKMQL